MRSAAVTYRLAMALGTLACAGCVTFEPAPLVSNDSYRFGIASRAFHREISEVAEATLKAMHDMSFQEIQKVDEVGKTRIEAFSNEHLRVRVDLEWKDGTPDGTPLPLMGNITGARVKIGDHGERDLSKTLLDRMAYNLKNHPPATAAEK
jgi:Protein of unknown function (DUF3568)